ncbi:MAG: transposase [Myxococcales bacterium]|nr:transposase [Myxococcales bacterium]
MPRNLRFDHDDYVVLGRRSGQWTTLSDITTPVINGRYFLRPDEQVADIILGVLGRAQARWPFDIYGFHVMSTHWHLLAGFTSGRQRARVMRFVNGEIARRINRLLGRRGPLFERRYACIQVLSDAHALERLRYLMSQATKAFVVRHPDDDPFVCSTPHHLRGLPLRGTWRGRGGSTRYTVEISPLPGLAALSIAEQRATCWQLADDIARRERQHRKKAGRRLQGAAAARTIDPWTRQPVSPRTPAPVVHGTPAQEADWRAAYGRARRAYTEATIAFRAWQADQATPLIPWPPGTVPPHFDLDDDDLMPAVRAGP